MKKLLFSIFFILLSTGAFAQVYVGAKAGVAGNWIPGTNILPDDDVLPNFGFYGGATLTFELSDFSAVQTELLYARKGILTKGETFRNKYVRDIHYLELPVLYSMRVADDRYRVMIGPEFGYALGTDVKNLSGKKDPASADALKRFNLGAVLQTTYFVTDNLGVDVKFDCGLTKTFSAGDGGHNASVMVGLSYCFGR